MTGEAPYAGADAKIPAAGSEIARVTEIARQLVKSPDLRGLTAAAAVADRELASAAGVPRRPSTIHACSRSPSPNFRTR